MFGVEQNGRHWVVVRDGSIVSVHPNHDEAERAVEWLVKRSVRDTNQALLIGDLTARELTVLQRLNHRGSYAQIARELFVSTNTLKTHVARIYAKLGVTNRGSALAAAAVLGLLDDDANETPDEVETGLPRDGRIPVTAVVTQRYWSAFAHALQTHDWTPYARLLRADAHQISPITTCDGVDEIIESNKRIIDAIPDSRVEARHVTVDPDQNRAMVECLHSGTLAGPLSTPFGIIPATGQRFQFESMHVVTFDEDGLASEIRRYWDLYEVLHHQGLARL